MPRLALQEHLCCIRSKRIANVIAPAGAGKTTLLARVFRKLDHEGLSCSWLSLDEQETCPAVFVQHFAQALQQALPHPPLKTFQQLSDPRAGHESILSSLINELAATDRHFVIFIDNFQEADTPDIATLLSYFLRYLPANIHLVLASQRDLPQALHWVRTRDWCMDLGWKDLCLKPGEIESLLQDFHALRLCDAEISLLAQNTGGWIGALQLACRACRQMIDLPLEKRLQRLNRQDYAQPLIEELLGKLPPELQAFITETSILDRLSPPLCDCVRGQNDSHTLLKALENIHGLAHRDDDQFLHYPVFLARFIGLRLQADCPERHLLLNRRAGDWYATQGNLCLALRHWLNAGAHETAAHFLLKHGQSLLPTHHAELSHCLDHLPPPLYKTHADLNLLRAWCTLISGKPVSLPESRPPTSSPPATELSLLQTLSCILRYDWPSPVVPQSFSSAFPDQETPLLHISTKLANAHHQRYRDELAQAQSSYRSAAELAESHRLWSLHTLAQQGVLQIDMLHARPDRALDRIKQWLFADGPSSPTDIQSTGLLLSQQALALMDRGLNEEALQAINKAIHLLENAPFNGQLGLSYVIRSHLKMENGHGEETLGDLARARTLALPHGIHRVLFRADLCEAAFCLTREAPEEAAMLLERAFQILQESGQSCGENFEAWQIAHCAWLIAVRREGEARDIALSGENIARNAGRRRHCIDFLLLRAAALARLPGNQAASRECIEQARHLAKPGGVCRPFRTLPPAIELLSCHGDSERGAAESVPLRLPDHLHQREEQILRLLEQGLRNREIAARLFLSDETVKWYLKRLYGNFAVENRVQLLATVRKLGLLSDGLH